MLRFVLLSVTEGADKPLKYPTILNGADVAIITEYDILAAVDFNASAAIRNVQSVRPGMQICHRKPARVCQNICSFSKIVEVAHG